MNPRSSIRAVSLGLTVLTLVWLTALALAETDGAPVDYESEIQPIFNVHCYSCHLRGAEPGGLALEPGVSYDELVNVPSEQSELLRVAPGDPEASYLLHKLRGTQVEVGGSGNAMPQGGGTLSDEAIALIEAWITSLPPAE